MEPPPDAMPPTGDAPEATGPPSDGPPVPSEGGGVGSFPVVGIGASAGGLKAFQDFFSALPARPDLAFVVVQHLSPDHESALAELVQAQTEMEVTQVADHPDVAPNRVYVIPPGKHLRIDGGRLHLVDPADRHERPLAVDRFFRSLAEDLGERAVCVVLSGTGSDGALGLKAVKERGGLTMAQDPADAAYDGMPRSAVATGLVDVTGTPAELARKLVEVRRAEGLSRLVLPDGPPGGDADALRAIFAHLRQRTGHDFSDYKRSTIRRRLARRLQVHGLDSLAAYASYLRSTPDEVEALLRDFLISVTQFFRDPEAFEALEAEAVPALFEGKGAGDTVRAWVAGCATGEEAYSVAMLLCEHRETLEAPPDLQVFATDIDAAALSKAREGLYPATAAGDLSPARRRRFFDEEADGLRVKAGLREVVLFARHNVIADPPFSRLDLVTCRNVLIYLTKAVQRRALAGFHYGLVDDGVLFLGSSEGPEPQARGFVEIDKASRIYRKRDVDLGTPRIELFGRPLEREERASTSVPARPPADGLVGRYNTWTLEAYAPPRLLVDEHSEVTHVFGRAGEYLRDREGPVTQSVTEKVLRAFRVDLRTALYRAFSKGEPTDTRFQRVVIDGEARYVRLHVGRVGGPAESDGLAEVVFVELDPASVEALGVTVADGGDGERDAEDPAVVRLEAELMRVRERLQATVEQQETSNEELKASNEELQSMNEELQSTTEELETSKEELQSMNEELHTLNQELKIKVEELSRSNADLQNLIASTEIATVFLDRALRVVRFTPASTGLFNLIPADVGRPLEHVTHRLDVDDLPAIARGVLDSLVPVEATVAGREGGTFSLRAHPYRTADDRIEGVVLTLVDVTAERAARDEALRRARQQEAVAALGRFALGAADPPAVFDRAVELVSRSVEAPLAKVLEADREGGVLRLVAGVGWAEGAVGAATVPDALGSQAGFTLMSRAPVIVPDLVTETRFVGPGLLTDEGVRSGISVPIPGPAGEPWGVLGVHAREPRQFAEGDGQFMEAVAGVLAASLRRAHDEATIRDQLAEIEAVYATAPVGLAFLGPDLVYRRVNRRLAEMNRAPVEAHLGRTVREVVPGLADQLEPVIREVVAGGEPVEDVEIRGPSPTDPDDDRVWLCSYVPVTTGGAVAGVSLVVRDVTERTRQADALEDTATRLSLALAAGGAGTYVVDLQTGRVRYDEAARQMLQEPSEMGLDAATAGVHPDDRSAFDARMQEAADPGTPTDVFTSVHRHRLSDGRTVWLSARGACEFEGEGLDRRPVRLVGAVVDVTDLKEAQESARRRLAEIDAYFEAVPVGIAVFDRDARYVRVNRRMAELMGREPEDLVGRPPDRIMPASHVEANEPFLRRVLSTGVPIRDVEMRLSPPAEPGGALRDWLVSFVPLVDGGAPTGAIVVVQDVTALKRAQEGLERLTAELEERVVLRTAQVRRLVGDLTDAERRERGRVAQVLHDDLQQLLYAAQFKLEAARNASAGAGSVEALFDSIEALLGRAVHVTRTLTVDLRPPVLEGEGLEATFEWLGHRMGEAYGLDVAVESEGPVEAGKTVQVLLFQIVRELLFNVVKHAGTSEAAIRVGPGDEGRVRVVIEDEGIGFEPEAADGFGISSVRERIRLVGGTVAVTSTPGEGARIEVVCPSEL